MKVYFAASISGGRARQPVMQLIVEHLKKMGFEVLSDHIARPDVLKHEANFSPQHIFARDLKWIQESDFLVSEVSTPSLGVGYEICYALKIPKPVICLCEEKQFLSAMLTGNDAGHLEILRYSSLEEIPKLLTTHLKQFKQQQ